MNSLDFWRDKSLAPFYTDFYQPFEKTLGLWMDDTGFPSRMLRTRGSDMAFNPKCEVSETASHYNFKIAVPGMTKDQFKIELRDNRLTVSGERRADRVDENKEKTMHVSEFSYGSFMRSFDIPTPVNNEKVEAAYKEGVLNIDILKETPSKARQITVR